MPRLRNTETGKETVVPDSAATRLLESGQWALAGGEQVEVRSSTGGRVRVGGRQLGADQTLKAVTAREQAEAIRKARLSRHTEGFFNKAKTLGEGFASGATFGAADILMDDEATRARQEFNSGLRTVGEIGGVVIPSLVAAIPTGGGSLAAGGARIGAGLAAKGLARGALRYTPAGIAARVGTRIAGTGGVARTAAAGAVEGAIGNAGFYLADTALGKRELSAEGLVGSMGEGALWGGGAGAAVAGLEKGFIRARKLFPKKAGQSKGAAEAAQAAFDDAVEQTLSASDELVTAARARLKENRAAKASLNLELARALEAGDSAAVSGVKGKLKGLRTADAEARYTIEHGAAPPPAAPRPTVDLPAPAAVADDAIPPPSTMPEGSGPIGEVALPSNFGRGPHVADEAAIHKGLPEFNAIDEDGIYVVHPREMLERGITSADGQAWSGDAVRLDKVRRGMDTGHEFDPLQFAVKPDGSLDVIDGRHRLVAAAERNQPVAVRFSRGIDTAAPADEVSAKVARLADEVESSKAEVQAWIDRMKGKAEPQWVRRTPEGGAWLRGNADLGVDIVGSIPDDELAHRFPSFDGVEDVRLDYDEIIQRAAREQDETARKALIRDAAELEDGAWDVTEQAFAAETRAARQRAGLTAEDVAQRRVDAAIGRMGKMKDADLDAFLAGSAPPAKVGKASKADEAFAPWDAEMQAEAARLPGVREDTDAWFARMGVQKNPATAGRLTDEVEEGIALLGAHDRARAELVTELGDAAPPAAKAQVDEYAKAVDDRATKATERTAQAADEVASAGSAAKKGKGRGKAPAPADEGSGALGKAADVGALLEGLGMAGVNLGPDVDKIPIIGPLLGLYLKARAAKAVLGRLGGKVPATAEARAASRAAGTRDRIASAVDRMLEGSAKVARRASSAAAKVAPRAAALGHTLFDDGVKRGAPANEIEAALHRIEELAAAQANPDGVRMAVRRTMRDAIDPSLVSAVEATVLRKLEYLAEHMPKAPPPSLLGRKAWKPSKTEVERFARRVRAAESPASVFEDLANGTITSEAADTLREVYPELYGEAQMRLIERAGEVTEELPYQYGVKLSLLFTAPLLASMRPERIAAYQAVGKSEQTQGGPQGSPAPTGKGPAPKLDSLFMPAADRRAFS